MSHITYNIGHSLVLPLSWVNWPAEVYVTQTSGTLTTIKDILLNKTMLKCNPRTTQLKQMLRNKQNICPEVHTKLLVSKTLGAGFVCGFTD